MLIACISPKSDFEPHGVQLHCLHFYAIKMRCKTISCHNRLEGSPCQTVSHQHEKKLSLFKKKCVCLCRKSHLYLFIFFTFLMWPTIICTLQNVCDTFWTCNWLLILCLNNLYIEKAALHTNQILTFSMWKDSIWLEGFDGVPSKIRKIQKHFFSSSKSECRLNLTLLKLWFLLFFFVSVS